jgi:hypothetical protein
MNKKKGTNYNSFEHKIIIQEAMWINGKHRTKNKTKSLQEIAIEVKISKS